MQPFTETDPKLGKAYHVGNTEEMQRLLDEEDGYWYHAHPRTKGTAGYPDAIWDGPYVKNDRYLGVAYKLGMGIDLSEIRTLRVAVLRRDRHDEQHERGHGASAEVHHRGHRRRTRRTRAMTCIPQFPVTYLKLDRVPGPTESWSSDSQVDAEPATCS